MGALARVDGVHADALVGDGLDVILSSLATLREKTAEQVQLFLTDEAGVDSPSPSPTGTSLKPYKLLRAEVQRLINAKGAGEDVPFPDPLFLFAVVEGGAPAAFGVSNSTDIIEAMRQLSLQSQQAIIVATKEEAVQRDLAARRQVVLFAELTAPQQQFMSPASVAAATLSTLAALKSVVEVFSGDGPPVLATDECAYVSSISVESALVHNLHAPCRLCNKLAIGSSLFGG